MAYPAVMKKNRGYIVYLSLAVGLFLVVKLIGPKEYDWTPTYAAYDKNPFGAYVLSKLMPDLFPGREVTVSNKTLYEIKDSVHQQQNIFILTHVLRSEKEDVPALLEHVSKGGVAFLSAQSFYGKLADTLKLFTRDYLFDNSMVGERRDSAYLQFVSSGADTSRKYVFRRDNMHQYFSRCDSAHTTVIAVNEVGQPVTLRTRWGKGSFILNCTPLAFTNIYALRRNSSGFAAATLSYLPPRDLHWTEYYSVGRREASTPLRFILRTEPLAWAYYLAVGSLLLFMIFEAKRKQRVIPVLQPLENTSLEFVTTIGNLYFQRGDHRNIAEKKILFFYEQLRTRYRINPIHREKDFITILAKKTGQSEQDTQVLFDTIDFIRSQASIRPEHLIALTHALEKYTLK
jgi:hypothetical protein